MKVLAIETSCDETGAAVLEKKNNTITVLSNITATSSNLHAKTGGIIPEFAAREQIKAIIPVITETLLLSKEEKAKSKEEKTKMANKILREEIDAISVTNGPGLIGSLLVGVETAKTLSFAFNKPLIPVHHLLAHLYANFITTTYNPQPTPSFPFIGLIVSGGHTDLLYFQSHNKYKWLGGTRDDAAGEALDKTGRILNLSYPAGPEIEERAEKGAETKIKFQSPLIGSQDFDFSFSGLKAEVARFVKNNNLTERLKDQICCATQKAIVQVLVKKTVRASKLYKVSNILLGGGVSANQELRSELQLNAKDIRIFAPEKIYSTDNAAMIGAYALLNPKPVPWRKISAIPNLYFA